jgi:hypothetical protein
MKELLDAVLHLVKVAVALVVVGFIVAAVQYYIHPEHRYGDKYQVPYSHVYIDPKLHDCEFEALRSATNTAITRKLKSTTAFGRLCTLDGKRYPSSSTKKPNREYSLLIFRTATE